VTLIRRSLSVVLLVCAGCVAQSAPPSLSLRIEHMVRSFLSLPAEVKVNVGAITPTSEMPGYDTIPVIIADEAMQKEYKFLLSKDRSTVLLLTKFDVTKDAFADLMSKIDVTGRPRRGAKSAKVTVVNFDDFECPYCAAVHQMLFPEILKEYGDRITFIYKDYPLSEIHPWAIHAAVDANCLASQSDDAYWDFADYTHANKSEVDSQKTPGARFDAVDKIAMLQGQKNKVDMVKLQSCVKAQDEDAVRASMKEANRLDVSATPTMFINGQRIDGAVPISVVRAALNSALKDAGQPVPEHIPSLPATASK
jgi:protein-disulfide isomerase